MSKIIIFHGPHCSDGRAAAWAFHKKYPDATFHAATHGNPPPDISGKEVFIVDFAYPRQVMLDIYSRAKSVVLLDHHKSAVEDLQGLVFCQFDMNRSGAGMAWDFCFPNQPRPWFINYIEDKDLWNWALPFSREINCNIQSHPLAFETLYGLEKIQVDSPEYKQFIAEGEAILRFQRNMVLDIAKNAREVDILGHKVLMSNSSVLASEVANYLSIDRPFGVVWFENENGEKVYSFRSKEKNGIDVSKIAARFGGGGHRSSAGARMKSGTDIMKFVSRPTTKNSTTTDTELFKEFADNLAEEEDKLTLSPGFFESLEEDLYGDEFDPNEIVLPKDNVYIGVANIHGVSKLQMRSEGIGSLRDDGPIVIRGIPKDITSFDEIQDFSRRTVKVSTGPLTGGGQLSWHNATSDVIFENENTNIYNLYGWKTCYNKDQYGLVHLQIFCHTSKHKESETIFTLPVGYRPINYIHEPPFIIYPDGRVKRSYPIHMIQSKPSIITFKAEQ